MSDHSAKIQKEELLKKLLAENPSITMKEANISIREACGTGVAPAMFSKIKKELSGDAGPVSPSEEASTPVIQKEPKSTKSPEVPEPTSSTESSSPEDSKAQVGEPASDENERPKAPKKKRPPKRKESEQAHGDQQKQDGDRSHSHHQQEDDEESSEPQSEKVEEEQELDPNLPKFPVHLEIQAPLAKEVHLAGSFNRWRLGEYPLKSTGEGFWVFDGELPQGQYNYKFVVDGKVWLLDLHRERVTDRTGVSHPITIGDALPPVEESNTVTEQPA